MTSPLPPEREAEIRARDTRAPWMSQRDLDALFSDRRVLLAALDHERAETQRLRDAIHDEATLLSRHAVAARNSDFYDEAELAEATVSRLRAALAAPTPEETP